jgi:hypothetical protein
MDYGSRICRIFILHFIDLFLFIKVIFQLLTKILVFYRDMVTLALFLARAFIAGAFQTIYVYTPEVRRIKIL